MVSAKCGDLCDGNLAWGSFFQRRACRKSLACFCGKCSFHCISLVDDTKEFSDSLSRVRKVSLVTSKKRDKPNKSTT